MEFANKAVNAAVKAANNNTVINVCLVGFFAALSVRSVSQQRDIEALEAHKDSLAQSNKAMKRTMWEWKQQLFAEASSNDSPLVPLSRLKAIYGEAPVSPQIEDGFRKYCAVGYVGMLFHYVFYMMQFGANARHRTVWF